MGSKWLLPLVLFAACGGSGGNSNVSPNSTPLAGDCSITGTFVNTGSGDIINMLTCNSNGTSVSSCRIESTGQPVDCGGAGGTNVALPTPTP